MVDTPSGGSILEELARDVPD